MRYGPLASIYDKVMSHVEYDDWIDLLKKISKKYSLKDNLSIFEIGGGTGVLGKLLVDNGYNYLGSDLSYYMSKEAAKKNIPFICTDARSLPVKSKFDLILFLYDGINYLNTIDEYKILFSQVSQCLNKGGIFLFDITTEYNSIYHFYDYTDFEEYDGCSVVRHSYYDELTMTQHNDFTIFSFVEETGLYHKSIDKHEQKVFPPQMIEEAIPGSKFEVLGIWDEFKMKKYSSRSERIHFCLKRK